jgi:hypothetical protein
MISLIHTGDKNAWVWKYWWYYYDKWWNSKIIPTVFLSEELKVDLPGVSSITTGKISWSEGLVNFLKEEKDEYILYWHEDHFPLGKIDFDILLEIERAMIEYNIPLVKWCGLLSGWGGAYGKTLASDIKIGDYSLRFYPHNLDYLVSHQPSIWNRKFLIESIKIGESPWQHELDGTRRFRISKPLIMTYLGELDPPDSSPIPYCEGIQNGKIYPGEELRFDISSGLLLDI